MNRLDYTSEALEARIAAADYVAGFRDVPRFVACCRECPNYGGRWGCPPFSDSELAQIDRYSQVLIVGRKLIPADRTLPLSRTHFLMRPELAKMNHYLLQQEQELGGMAFGFAGTCTFCGDQPCARPEGQSCRHPELVRPSLEAYGFDVSRTASELLGVEMKWSHDGLVPEYLTLVGAVFY